MNYNLNNNQPNFGAIKMIKCSNHEYFKILEKYGDEITKSGSIFFKNRSIYDVDTFSYIQNSIKKNNFSSNWIIDNCKLNGINLPNTDNAPLFEISDKDLPKLALLRIKSIFKGFLFSLKNFKNIVDIPEHLKPIKSLNDFANKEYQNFLNFLIKNNAQAISYEQYLEELALRFGK